MAGLLEMVKAEKPAMRRARDRLPPEKWQQLRGDLIKIGKEGPTCSWDRVSELVEKIYGVRYSVTTLKAIAFGRSK